jgi:dUTP pyrophosphatase
VVDKTAKSPLPLLDVKGIRIGELRHQVTVTLCIGSHEEGLTLDVAPIRQHQIILGLPWLEAHDPEVTWSMGHIRFGSHYCNENCMPHPNDVFTQRQPTVTLNTMEIELFATRRAPGAQIPTRGSARAAGWDLYSIESAEILPGQCKLVDTGISMEFPSGMYGRIALRSGLALKHGITIGAGVIDPDYGGNIQVLIMNQGQDPVNLVKGDRIAQLVPKRYFTGSLKEVDQITETAQGSQGFGSTRVQVLTPEEVELFAIDLMLSATEETLRKIIPPEYHDYLDVFDPEGPMRKLPPLRPGFDFEIKLDPTKPLPKPARPYHMNPAEQEDWIKWRDTMLAAGLIAPAPASTPVAAPFFFVWKKHGTQRPVIDYQKLNDITIKDSYPLPCIDEMLECMHGAKVFQSSTSKWVTTSCASDPRMSGRPCS